MPYALGIDLGSGHLTAALSRNDHERWSEPETVVLDGSPAAEAVLHLTDEGTVEVGSRALRHVPARSDRVARGFVERVGDEVPILLGGRPYPAEGLIAALIGWIVDHAEAVEGGPASHLVVAHPADWGTHRRATLVNALREVGLPELTLLPRPVAAAESYAATERVEVGQEIAVHSLGAGRFESAVLRRGSFGFELCAHADSAEPLGGDLFDDLLAGHVLAELDMDIDAVGLAKLRVACRTAKERLSTELAVTVPAPARSTRGTVMVNRTDLEELVRPAVEATVTSLRRTIQAAGTSTGSLRAVVLVGGSGRIPLVSELVSAGVRVRVAAAADPEQSVARGAALAAARVAKPTVQSTALAHRPIARSAVTHTDLMRFDDLPAEEVADIGPPPPRPPVEIAPLEPPRRRLLRLGTRIAGGTDDTDRPRRADDDPDLDEPATPARGRARDLAGDMDEPPARRRAFDLDEPAPHDRAFDVDEPSTRSRASGRDRPSARDRARNVDEPATPARGQARDLGRDLDQSLTGERAFGLDQPSTHNRAYDPDEPATRSRARDAGEPATSARGQARDLGRDRAFDVDEPSTRGRPHDLDESAARGRAQDLDFGPRRALDSDPQPHRRTPSSDPMPRREPDYDAFLGLGPEPDDDARSRAFDSGPHPRNRDIAPGDRGSRRIHDSAPPRRRDSGFHDPIPADLGGGGVRRPHDPEPFPETAAHHTRHPEPDADPASRRRSYDAESDGGPEARGAYDAGPESHDAGDHYANHADPDQHLGTHGSGRAHHTRDPRDLWPEHHNTEHRRTGPGPDIDPAPHRAHAPGPEHHDATAHRHALNTDHGSGPRRARHPEPDADPRRTNTFPDNGTAFHHHVDTGSRHTRNGADHQHTHADPARHNGYDPEPHGDTPNANRGSGPRRAHHTRDPHDLGPEHHRHTNAEPDAAPHTPGPQHHDATAHRHTLNTDHDSGPRRARHPEPDADPRRTNTFPDDGTAFHHHARNDADRRTQDEPDPTFHRAYEEGSPDRGAHEALPRRSRGTRPEAGHEPEHAHDDPLPRRTTERPRDEPGTRRRRYLDDDHETAPRTETAAAEPRPTRRRGADHRELGRRLRADAELVHHDPDTGRVPTPRRREAGHDTQTRHRTGHRSNDQEPAYPAGDQDSGHQFGDHRTQPGHRGDRNPQLGHRGNDQEPGHLAGDRDPGHLASGQDSGSRSGDQSTHHPPSGQDTGYRNGDQATHHPANGQDTGYRGSDRDPRTSTGQDRKHRYLQSRHQADDAPRHRYADDAGPSRHHLRDDDGPSHHQTESRHALADEPGRGRDTR